MQTELCHDVFIPHSKRTQPTYRPKVAVQDPLMVSPLSVFIHPSIVFFFRMKSLVVPDKENFQHILRVLNTNIDGKHKIMYALTSVKGVGRRYANVCCKKADIDMSKR